LLSGEEVSALKARIKFRKYGVMKFIGHLDIIRYFQKVMRRADIPIAFTQGFSPHMIMSFAQPLGVGVTSDAEYFDIELTEPISSKRAIEQMNNANVDGIEVVSFVEIPDDKKSSGMTIVAAAEYAVSILESNKTSDITKDISNEWREKIAAFMAQTEIRIMKQTKRSEKEVDIKPMIFDMEVCDNRVCMFLATGSEQNLKPDLVMKAFLEFADEPEDTPLHYHRLEVYAKNPENSSEYISLEELGKEIM